MYGTEWTTKDKIIFFAIMIPIQLAIALIVVILAHK